MDEDGVSVGLAGGIHVDDGAVGLVVVAAAAATTAAAAAAAVSNLFAPLLGLLSEA